MSMPYLLFCQCVHSFSLAQMLKLHSFQLTGVYCTISICVQTSE